jgi:hypothetical protein
MILSTPDWRSIDAYQNMLSSKHMMVNNNRTPDDALRLGVIILLPEYRGSVPGIIGNKHDRAKADAPNDVTKAFFETIYEEKFSDPMFIADRPNDEYWMNFPAEKNDWDPNKINRIGIAHNDEWMTNTWRKYLRKKYHGAL